MATKESMEIVARTVRVDFGELPEKRSKDNDEVSSGEGTVVSSDWYAGNAALTEIFHSLSITFPVGETFFIDSVMHYAPRLKRDHPKLWNDVQLFFKQEGMHTAVHEAWNNRIMQEFGHPMNNIEKLVDEGLERVKASLPHLSQLAITACLEHWTAGLGHVLLCTEAGEQTLSQCAEPYRSLWTWHAVEEIEHKSVAFDVYQAMGGGYFRRIFTMIAVSISFVVSLVRIWWFLAITRRRLPVWASLKSFAYFLLWSPGMLAKFIPHGLAWFKPGYHPSKHYTGSNTEREHVQRHVARLAAKAMPGHQYNELRPQLNGHDSNNDDIISAGDSVIVLGPSPLPVHGQAGSELVEPRQASTGSDIASPTSEITLRRAKI